MYTKHYYAGSSRIASRIGGGFVPHKDLNDYSPVAEPDRVDLLQTTSYEHKAENLRNLWARAGECMGMSLEYAYWLDFDSFLKNTETADGERYFYHSDHLGSSAYITTENGYATQFLAYMPYGETLAEQQNGTSYYSPFKFSAKEKDPETGYSYFGARYYSPELSVWLSVDPMADKRPWLSAYNYCQLNPVMRVDPTGMIDIMIEDFSGGGEGDGNGDPPAKSSAPKNQPGGPSGIDRTMVSNNNLISEINGQVGGRSSSTTRSSLSPTGFDLSSFSNINGGFGTAFGIAKETSLAGRGQYITSKGLIRNIDFSNLTLNSRPYAVASKFISSAIRSQMYIQFGLDSYSYFNNRMSAERYAANTGVTAWGVGVGWLGMGIPALIGGTMYFGIDAFYPGGISGAMQMSGSLIQQNQMILGPGFNLYRDF